jgi:cysteine-rich repeat protein
VFLELGASNLTLTLLLQARQGMAEFEGLRVQKAAGAGYRLSFFLIGSGKECFPGALRKQCEEWASRRTNGGAGGYHVELLGPELTVVPDKLVLTPFGNLAPPWRIGETLKAYRVTAYDSADMNSMRSEISVTDNLVIKASLYSDSGIDVTASLGGTTAQMISAGIAEFEDLVVTSVVGTSFTLVFSASWRDRCLRKLIDEACAGQCCMKVSNLDIFPQQMLIGHPQNIPLVTEGVVFANFSVLFTDFSGNVLAQVGAEFGLQAHAHLSQRGILLAEKLSGRTISGVGAGVAKFTDLSIYEHAGRDISVIFSDRTSQISTQSARFDVYPRSIYFDGTLGPAVAGGPIQTGGTSDQLVIKLLSTRGQVLSAVRGLDNFTIEVFAAKSIGGSWVNCTCLLGPGTALAQHGVATFNASLLSIPSAVGTFSLQFRLQREGLPPLATQSNPFDVKPQGIYFQSSSLQKEAMVGDILGSVTLGFRDNAGLPLDNAGDMSAGSFQALLVQDSVVLATHHLAGNTTRGVDGTIGGASFGDLRVERFVGASMRLKFVFTATVGNETTVFELFSSTFIVRPTRLGINNTLPNSVTDSSMPALNVSVLDNGNMPLPMIRLKDAIEISIELHTVQYLGCSSLSVHGSSYADVTWEQCARYAVVSNAPYFVTGRDSTPGVGFCGIGSNASLGAGAGSGAGAGAELPSSLECAIGCEQAPGGCSPSSFNRLYYGIANSTAFLMGDRSEIVNGGSVIFSGLRITGLYGIKSIIIAVRNRGTLLPDVVETSQTFTVDPVTWKITGLPSMSHILSQPLPNTTITVTDRNGHKLESIFANDAYLVETTLIRAGIEVNHRLGLPHSRVMPNSILSFAMHFLKTGGSNFTVRLSMKMPGHNNSLLSLESPHFILYPDQLILVGPQGTAFDGSADSVLQTLQIRCEDSNGTLITDIQTTDNLKVLVGAVNLNNAAIPACGTLTVGCLGGSILVAVSNGVAIFNNITFVAYAGSGTRLNFRISGGGPAPVFSSKFSLFPTALYITQGEYKFRGVKWIINKGLGDYSVSLRGTAGQIVPLSLQEGFQVTASLRQAGSVDLTSALSGTRVRSANHSYVLSTSATFTDLVVTQATGTLALHFTLSHPNSSLTVGNSTQEFTAVPYALRISQKCFNGLSVGDNMSAVPYGLPLLQCVGPGVLASDLGRDFGRFGYLTGYYRYENNQNVGPLLRNTRGGARVPPIDVLATDLYLHVQTLIKPTHSFTINLDLFVGDQQYTSYMTGSTSQVMNDGVAKFRDLSISSIPACKPNCTLVFLFSLGGVLCTDTWCTNVTMGLSDTPIVAPHLLGSHPGFPGMSHVEGDVSLPCILAPEFGSSYTHPTVYTENQNIFRQALLAASAVPFLFLDSIELTSIQYVDGLLRVSFRIRAKSDAAATSLMSTVTDQFRDGTQIIRDVCIRLNKTDPVICAQCGDTPKLVGKLTRTVVSYLSTDSFKLPSPKFSPPGLPEGSCVTEGWASSSGTCVVAFGPFVEFYLDLTIVDGTTNQKRIYYTLDTCPIATIFCNATGSIPTDANTISDRVSYSGLSPLRLRVFGTSPTKALPGLPDGFSEHQFQGFFSGDVVEAEIQASVLSGFLSSLLASGRYVGIRGNRQTSVMPEYLTVRAFGKSGTRKAPSFPSSTTFRLSPQASTPEVDLANAELWVLGWCNETHSSYPNARVGDEFIRSGSCADIQHVNDSSVCSGASIVPCRLSSAEAFCTAGSKGYTLSQHALYDGVLVRASGATVLSKPFQGPQDTRLRVESVSALGFTNDGVLLHPRNISASCPAGGCSNGMFTVTRVRQADKVLEVEYTHEFSYAAGTVISLHDTCTAGLVHQALILPLSTKTAGSSIYFNIPGTDPTNSSHILGPANSLTINVTSDTSLRAVAGGPNMMNSPYIHLDITQPCGNGVINGGEQCDDGNLVDGDLCSSLCMFELKCSAAIWQDVTHENIGIQYMDSGANHGRPDALHVSNVLGNGTSLLSDCEGYLLVSHLEQIVTGGFRHFNTETSKGRFSEISCTATIGTEILMAGDYLHSLRRDSQGNPIQGLNNLYSFDPVSQVFADSKYQLKFPKNAMVCEGQGSKAYFAGGITLNETGSKYVMVDDIDELEVIPPAVEGLEATHRWTYAKWRLSVPRMYLASARNGNLIAFGGGVNTNPHEFAIYANVDILDIETGQMNYTYMPVSRYLHAMASVGPYILLAGGVNYFGYIRSVDIYDTRYRNFTNFPNGLTRPRAILAGAATPTKAFFAGGFDGGVLSDVDMFDSVTGLFSPVKPLKEGRYSLIGVGALDLAMFGGGRRRDGENPTGSKCVDIYEDIYGNHTFREMDSPRFMHYGGAAKQYIIFGLGLSSDPGFQNELDWLNAGKVQSIDVFDVSVMKTVIMANVTSPGLTQISSKKVILPYYHVPTRTLIDVPVNTTSYYDITDMWQLTCEPGFRKTKYQSSPETVVYTSFVCACTNLTNFFYKPSLYPSDQAVRA